MICYPWSRSGDQERPFTGTDPRCRSDGQPNRYNQFKPPMFETFVACFYKISTQAVHHWDRHRECHHLTTLSFQNSLLVIAAVGAAAARRGGIPVVIFTILDINCDTVEIGSYRSQSLEPFLAQFWSPFPRPPPRNGKVRRRDVILRDGNRVVEIHHAMPPPARHEYRLPRVLNHVNGGNVRPRRVLGFRINLPKPHRCFPLDPRWH
jgi:hypothetical protein